MNYSKGISWIDDCRIPFVNENDPSAERYKYRINTNNLIESGYGFNSIESKEYTSQGRFPANILCSDDVLNDGCISNGNKPSKRNKNHRYSMDYGLKVFEGMDITGYSDKGTNSRYYDIDKWFNELLYNI